MNSLTDGIKAQTPFGDIEIKITAENTNDLQKLRDIIINFYEGLACMCQNMGDECSTYGFYAEDREEVKTEKPLEICKHANIAYINPLCELHGGVCEFAKEPFKFSECAMYEPYPF